MHSITGHAASSNATVRRLFSDRSHMIMLTIAAAGVLLAFFLWTFPNLGQLAQVLPQQGTLWQQSGYRRMIVVLFLKVCSPLLVLLITGVCFLLWQIARPYLEEARQSRSSTNTPISPPFAAPTMPLQHNTASKHHRTQISVPLAPVSLAPASSAPTLSKRERKKSGSHPVATGGSQGKRLTSSHAAYLYRRRQERLRSGARTGSNGTDPSDKRDVPGFQAAPATMRTVPPSSSTSQEMQAAGTQSRPLVSITLLRDVSLVLHASNGEDWSVPLRPTAKRIQLLAYMAYKRGSTINREKMLEQVFGHGLSDEQATPVRLADMFDSHKKFLRADIRMEVAKVNKAADCEVLPPNLDIFAYRQNLWGLSESCCVVDLDEIEAQYRVIESAKAGGLLGENVPDTVKAACDRLIAAYPGDFLQSLIRDYPDEFEPWVSSWVRTPFTLYRDYYLRALWYAAEYERRMGEQHADERPVYYGRAAELYWKYALYACNNKFDTKITFGREGRGHGERVVMSERALRRSLVLYGAIENTYLIDELFTTYYKQMRQISGKLWEPGQDTLADLKAAKERTSAYRFDFHVTPDDMPVFQEKLPPYQLVSPEG